VAGLTEPAGDRDFRHPLIEPHEGVYVPATDSAMLLRAFVEHEPPDRSDVLELCCGSGFVAIGAAARGHHVDAVDSDRRAVTSARRNADLNGVSMRVFQGDLFEPLGDARYDVLLANPPYVPTPERGPIRRFGWCDGGPDGRALIDRICEAAPERLWRGGLLLLAQSSLADVGRSIAALEEGGLAAEIVASRSHPLGPISTERRRDLTLEGFLEPGATHEQLVVIAARAA
jgi:release factor glutamine methyltransferase